MWTWTKDIVNTHLSRYKEDKARMEHLRVEIDREKADIEEAERVIELNPDALGAQNLSGMPHSTKISDPTAQTAIRLATGWVPKELKIMRDELDELVREFEDKKKRTAYVDAWLLALTERESWVIQKQVIGGEIWRDIMDDYEKVYRVRISQDSLARMKQKALKKIYALVGIKEQGQ